MSKAKLNRDRLLRLIEAQKLDAEKEDKDLEKLFKPESKPETQKTPFYRGNYIIFPSKAND